MIKTFNFHVHPKSKESDYFRGFLIDVTIKSKGNRFCKDFESKSKKELWDSVIKFIGSLGVETRLKCNNEELIIN